MAEPHPRVIGVSPKTLWAAVGTLVTLVGLGLTVHGAVFLPSILHQVDGMLDKKIANHAATPHTGAVSRGDLEMLVLDRLDRMESQINTRLTRIEEKLP